MHSFSQYIVDMNLSFYSLLLLVLVAIATESASLERKGKISLSKENKNLQVEMVQTELPTSIKGSLTDEELIASLKELLVLLNNSSFPTKGENSMDSLDTVVDESLAALILEDILINSFSDFPNNDQSKLAKELSSNTNDQSVKETPDSSVGMSPQLQFLEPDLGPAVLPLQVPNGYFVPFIPRQAFGVDNGVARPAHGHASFYKYRPRGLVDVLNSPAYGFLLRGS